MLIHSMFLQSSVYQRSRPPILNTARERIFNLCLASPLLLRAMPSRTLLSLLLRAMPSHLGFLVAPPDALAPCFPCYSAQCPCAFWSPRFGGGGRSVRGKSAKPTKSSSFRAKPILGRSGGTDRLAEPIGVHRFEKSARFGLDRLSAIFEPISPGT